MPRLEPSAEADTSSEDELLEEDEEMGSFGPRLMLPSLSTYDTAGKKPLVPQKRSFGDYHTITTIREDLKEEFINRKYTQPRSEIAIPKVRRHEHEGQDYNEVLLCHAQLYVLADRFFVPDLKALAIKNLHEALVPENFTLYKSRVGDIVALLDYVYKNTNMSESSSAS